MPGTRPGTERAVNETDAATPSLRLFPLCEAPSSMLPALPDHPLYITTSRKPSLNPSLWGGRSIAYSMLLHRQAPPSEHSTLGCNGLFTCVSRLSASGV